MKRFFNLIILACFLVSLLVSPAISGAATSTKIQKTSKLLLELENSIKPTSLSSDWGTGRIKWIAKVKDANSVRKIRKQVYTLELNLKYNSQFSDWRSIRSEWVSNIKVVKKVKKLVNLIIQLDAALKWASHQTSWRTKRKLWIKRALKLTGSSNIPNKMEEQNQGSVAQFKKLGNLVYKLEVKIKYAAQARGWRRFRREWKRTIRKASSINQLIKGMILLHKNFKTKYLAKVWNSRLKRKW